MELVLDANILISALIKDSHTRNFLLISNTQFYVPEFVFEEIKEHIIEIREKTSLSAEEIGDIVECLILSSNIRIIPFQEFRIQYEDAKKISPDINDAHYFALALKFKCPIWSNDKKLKEQHKVIVYESKEILTLG